MIDGVTPPAAWPTGAANARLAGSTASLGAAMMCAVKITSGPEHITSGSPATAGLGRRRAQAAATAIVGLILLANAHSLPWVAVRPGQSIEDRLLGQAPSAEVRTYALTDLPGARTSLYVGWALLLSLLVVAWVRPEWRRGVRVAASVLPLALALLTFVPGGAAISASGFPRPRDPVPTSSPARGSRWSGCCWWPVPSRPWRRHRSRSHRPGPPRCDRHRPPRPSPPVRRLPPHQARSRWPCPALAGRPAHRP